MRKGCQNSEQGWKEGKGSNKWRRRTGASWHPGWAGLTATLSKRPATTAAAPSPTLLRRGPALLAASFQAQLEIVSKQRGTPSWAAISQNQK